MSGGKGVVFALADARKAGQPAALAQMSEPLAPPGQYFMHIGLMPHVEHNAILGLAEHILQRQRQLDHAQIGREMSALLQHRLDQQRADLARELFHLLNAESFQILRRIDPFEHS